MSAWRTAGAVGQAASLPHRLEKKSRQAASLPDMRPRHRIGMTPPVRNASGQAWRGFLGRYTYAVLFLCGSVALFVAAWLETHTAATIIDGWFAVDLLVVAVAYLWGIALVFGKTPHGSMRLLVALPMLPFLLATWIVWRIQTTILAEPIWNEVVPGLWVGRRCRWRQLPPGVTSIIDCTAGFPSDGVSRRTMRWLSLPILDGCAPTWGDCLQAFKFIDQESNPALFVCCAQGHGRSVTLAAVLLMKWGLAATAREAFEMIKRHRPGASLNGEQWTFLEQAAQRLAGTACSAAR
jgi:hypothetical protein